MDLSIIPLPETQTGLTITAHPVALPTAHTWAPGIVHVETGDDGRVTRMTAQCSVCLRTAMGRSATAVVLLGRWDFAPDPEELGHVKYRRCPDCQAAREHPEHTES